MLLRVKRDKEKDTSCPLKRLIYTFESVITFTVQNVKETTKHNRGEETQGESAEWIFIFTVMKFHLRTDWTRG